MKPLRASLRTVFAALLATASFLPSRAEAGESFKIIVNPSVQGSQIKRETVAAIFLREVTRWPDGHEIAAVDQSARSPLRARFSTDALHQSIVAVQNRWLQLIQQGRMAPPPVKASDADVASFVRSTEGSIGYVSSDFPDDPGVKVLRVLD